MMTIDDRQIEMKTRKTPHLGTYGCIPGAPSTVY